MKSRIRQVYRPETGHLFALDGLRGLAVTAVFAHHVAAPQHLPWAYARSNSYSVLLRLLEFGWGGVDLFFVLSGFLITAILLRSRDAENYFSSFYMRRVLRIFPLYYLAVALTFLWPLLTRAHGPQYPWYIQIWFWLNLSNWPTSLEINLVPPLLHFWTLAIEEQFYLLWPLLVRRLPVRTLGWICALAVPLELALRFVPALQHIDAAHTNFLYRITPTHSEGLFSGALLAILIYRGLLGPQHLGKLRWATAVLGVAAGGTLYAAIFSLVAFELRFTMLCLFFTSLVAWLAVEHGSGTLSRLLSREPLLTLGRYSFCIYVVHLPLLQYVQRHIVTLPRGTRLFWVAQYVAAYLLTIVIAALSWRFFEAPLLSLKRHFPYRFRIAGVPTNDDAMRSGNILRRA